MKITFMGAGSTVFAKSILGDCLLSPALREAHFALYDIDGQRLRDSERMLRNLNENINGGRARVTAHHGVRTRKAALRGADFVVNAIQVGGYEPATVLDFEIPRKYGLLQTIADTIGVGGVFRALRTIPVMLDFARDMEEVAPDAWFLNYTNPMSMVTGAVLLETSIRTVGLCHSVQACAPHLLWNLRMADDVADLRYRIAGINHMAWLLEIRDGDRDLYPEVKKRAAKLVREARRKGNPPCHDMIRLEMMRHFGYYITESSEHSAEYYPYWIKRLYPGLIDEFGIPIDEYLRRCRDQIAGWERQRDEIVNNRALTHERTHEYGSHIMEAIVTDRPLQIGGNVLNRGLITNLPSKAVVEVPCLVDANGVQGTVVGDLPEQLAALNRTHINVHLVTLEAARTLRRDHVYQAVMLDPHAAAELSLDEIRRMCDELIEAHDDFLPKFR